MIKLSQPPSTELAADPGQSRIHWCPPVWWSQRGHRTGTRSSDLELLMGGARGRRPLSFIAWGIPSGRPTEMAAQLGGEARSLNLPSSWPVLVRYMLYTAATLAHLLIRRPRALIVTNPPIVPGLIAVVYARLTGASVLLDSHPGGFGAQGDARSARVQVLHRWAARRVASVLVTTEDWADLVRSWGGVADVTHEAPPIWNLAPPPRLKAPPRVLYVGIFGRDEPVQHLVAAAELVPEAEFHVTGDPARCPPQLLQDPPPNVTFTGFLRGQDYQAAIEEANLVVTLTTEPTSIMRAACEAVYAQRPLVVSDWPALRQTFPHAAFVANSPQGIAAGIRQVIDHYDEFCAAVPEALAIQHTSWTEQLHRLERRLGVVGRCRNILSGPKLSPE